MILSDSMIRSHPGLAIEPPREESLQPASHDLTWDCAVDGSGQKTNELGPGQTVYALTRERVTLPADVCGFIKDRSSFMRMGLGVTQGFVDPGFSGKLTVAVTNRSGKTVAVPPGSRFCQLVFAQCAGPARSPYDGHYQDSDSITVFPGQVDCFGALGSNNNN